MGKIILKSTAICVAHLQLSNQHRHLSVADSLICKTAFSRCEFVFTSALFSLSPNGVRGAWQVKVRLERVGNLFARLQQRKVSPELRRTRKIAARASLRCAPPMGLGGDSSPHLPPAASSATDARNFFTCLAALAPLTRALRGYSPLRHAFSPWDTRRARDLHSPSASSHRYSSNSLFCYRLFSLLRPKNQF
jgi:hypothetical protein